MGNTAEKILFAAGMAMEKLWSLGRRMVRIHPPSSIFAVKLDEIGDMVTCVHVFAMLKRDFPDAQITVLCKPYCQSLIAGDPHVDSVITNEAQWPKHADMILHLRGNWKTLLRSLITWPRYFADRGTVRFRNRGRQMHETETNAEVIRPFLINPAIEPNRLFPGQKSKNKVETWMEENGIRHFAILHTGARAVLRRWPADRYLALAQWLRDSYQLQIVLPGGKEDAEGIDQLISKFGPGAFRFTEGFDLLDFAVLCEKAKLFVGNESGPMQIADTTQVPILGLFGPGVERVFYPRSVKSKVIHEILECNPCDQIHCRYPENTCMQRIELEFVKREIAALLD